MQKLAIEIERVFIDLPLFARPIHVIWMADKKYHSSLVCDPFQLLFPQMRIAMLEEYEQSHVLSESTGKLDETSIHRLIHVPDGEPH